MSFTSQTAQLFHAPYTCSSAVRLAAAWGHVDLNVLPVSLGETKTELEKAHETANPLRQVSTLILPDGTILTETSACLVWVQSQSKNLDFKRISESSEYFQMLRWIGFCATELHKQLLRIVFYDEATHAVKDNFRALSESRVSLLDTHLQDRTVLVGETRSAADAYILWFLTLCDRAEVSLAPYKNITNYYLTHQKEPLFETLAQEDRVLKQSLS